MKRHNIVFLPGLVLLCLAVCMCNTLHAQPAPPPPHQPLSLHLAVGTVNGARAGMQYFPLRSLAVEISAGYVRVELLEDGGRKESTNGYSVTLGGNYYTHPDVMITPLISVVGIYVRTDPVVQGSVQQRFALVPSVGSRYSFLEDYSVFFRFGPAFHMTRELGTTNYKTLTQFDAGFAVRL